MNRSESDHVTGQKTGFESSKPTSGPAGSAVQLPERPLSCPEWLRPELVHRPKRASAALRDELKRLAGAHHYLCNNSTAHGKTHPLQRNGQESL
jgi:hypothetical protein